MKVTLIDYTGMGNPDPDHAINVLIFTKQTRLTMSPGLMKEISEWPKDKKLAELEYMANTIPSSWEFVDYTFCIEGVTRAFTHQFVRSRTWSFAQQTMRVLDVSTGPGWGYLTGPSINTTQLLNQYNGEMDNIAECYETMIASGAKVEDARGILPTNILTNIIGKCNMRNFVDLVRKRSSPRTQGEYRDVLDAMKAAVLEVHPWIDLFINRDADKAINELQTHVNNLHGSTVSDETKNKMTKLLDQLRSKV